MNDMIQYYVDVAPAIDRPNNKQTNSQGIIETVTAMLPVNFAATYCSSSMSHDTRQAPTQHRPTSQTKSQMAATIESTHVLPTQT